MATIKGTNAGETKTGTAYADLIYGYGGNDALYGRAGNDQIWGGLGDDKVYGEDGNDILRGEDGRDSIWGGNGTDTIYGGIGDDSLYGDAGTDTIYGGAGNDTLKGGTGISKLYGGAGYDTAYYDPSTSDIDAIGNYLSSSYIEAEKIYIYNKTTDNGLPTQTVIYNPDVNTESHDQYIRFSNESKRIEVGYTEGNPELIVVGAGGLRYIGPDFGDTSRVTGTAVNDEFFGGYESEILKGGAGNDDFHIKGGIDLLISETNDADRFYLSPFGYGAQANVTGFNGEGAAGGDVIYLYSDSAPGITVSNGKTTFDISDSWEGSPVETLTVDAVGLVPGTDWFLIA